MILALAMTPAVLLGAPDPEILSSRPTADTILERALQCVERNPSASVLARYTAKHTNRTHHLDRSGEVVERHTDVYRIRPVNGEPFYELLERDGKPATSRDLRREAERRKRFRESFDSEADMAHETSIGFALSSAVLERYELTLDGLDPVRGWALRFEPRTGDLPSYSRIDQVLNRLGGTLWIDEHSFGLRAVKFELREPLKIWAGLLGTLTQFSGQFEQVEVAPSHWLPLRMRLEMDGWAPFHSLKRRVELDWRDYQPVAPVE